MMEKAELICNFLNDFYDYCKIHDCESCAITALCRDINLGYSTRQEVCRAVQELETFKKLEGKE